MRVLVTALGTLSARAIVNQLKKEYSNIEIIGMDIYPKEYIVTANEVDAFYQGPSVVGNDQYLDYIIAFCEKQKINYIFPIIDEEVELLSQNKEMLKAKGIIACVSDTSSVTLCRDKLQTFECIKEKVPNVYVKTFLLSEYTNQIAFPVFVKPRKGRASIGCQRIDTLEQLNALKKEVESQDYIVQEYCEGNIFSIDIVRDTNNQCVGVIRNELLKNKNGAATTVKITDDKQLIAIGKRIAEAINILGVCNIEVFEKEGVVRLIEVNPRFPAGTEFSCMAGVDLVNQHFRVINGGSVVEENSQIDMIISRRYEAYVM